MGHRKVNEKEEDFRKRILEDGRNYSKNNKDKINLNKRKWKITVRNQLIEILGNYCRLCNTIEGLEIDHINGGGKIERLFRFHNDHWSMYRYYRDNPLEAKEKLQILCKKCNRFKQSKLKENGKEYKKKMNPIIHTYLHKHQI